MVSGYQGPLVDDPRVLTDLLDEVIYFQGSAIYHGGVEVGLECFGDESEVSVSVDCKEFPSCAGDMGRTTRYLYLCQLLSKFSTRLSMDNILGRNVGAVGSIVDEIFLIVIFCVLPERIRCQRCKNSCIIWCGAFFVQYC